jgi:multiple antibiotic resistance protein
MMAMIETAVRAFTTFFATVGPVDVAAFYAVLTASASPHRRRAMAIKGTVVATILLLLFIVFGRPLLDWLGISLPALRTAGGILLLLLAIDMAAAPPSHWSSATKAEADEAESREDIAVFPLATPLIAGPGALGAAVLLSAEAAGSLMHQLVVALMMLAVMVITLGLLLVAARVHRLLGVTGQNLISRVVGILLAALSVQFIFDGIRGSGIFVTQ